jgi:phosphoribosylamine--glycine ligase
MKNILVIGSGGREHAFVLGLKNSPQAGKIFALPGNAGINQDAIGVDISQSDFPAIAEFCRKENIAFVIVGPEQPLVDGLVDYLNTQNIKVFGPKKDGARLEGSKDYMKYIAAKYNVPTAKYQSFDDKQKAIEYIKQQGAPIVVKTDGLAAGKGVTVAMNLDDAIKAVEEAFAGKFGKAGLKLVIEEFLEGEEASFFVITDGKSAKYFGSAQDHKRAFDNDTGPNTGGMGTYSPASIVTENLIDRVMNEIIAPTMAGLQAEGVDYKGFLFAGLMIDKAGNPKLIEYNIRMGDPETQVIIPRIESDLVDIFEKAIAGNLSEINVNFSSKSAVCVVYASKGYPEDYFKNQPINLNGADKISGALIYHAGTKFDGTQLVSNGGRVLGVSGVADNFKLAREIAYKAVSTISFEGGFYRKDIGWRAM